jgi:hypothetical protein
MEQRMSKGQRRFALIAVGIAALAFCLRRGIGAPNVGA